MMAAVFYSLFNFFCGQNQGNAISFKIVSSYIHLLGFILISVYQVWKKRTNETGEPAVQEQSQAVSTYIQGVIRKEKDRQSVAG